MQEVELKEKSNKISANDSERYKFIKELAQRVRQDDQDRQTWKDKQVVAYNLRLGLRKRTNNPYPGASSVPIPITDKFITKLKAMYVSVATMMKKQIVVTVEEGVEQPPFAKESAKRIESALNGLVRKRDFQWAKKITLFVDYFLENGHSLFKVIEKFYTKKANIKLDLKKFPTEDLKAFRKLKDAEIKNYFIVRYELDPDDDEDAEELTSIVKQVKGGKNFVQFTVDKSYSEPSVIPEKGIRIIVPSSTCELQNTTRITHDMWMPYHKIKELAESGIYDGGAVEKLDPDNGTNDDSLTTNSWATAEGINPSEQKSTLFNVRECQTYYEDKKWVFTWVERSADSVNKGQQPEGDIVILQERELPYSHGLFTYVKHDFELKSPRWYSSRGVPEKIRGLHQTIEKMYNARLIRDEFNNAPMWRVSKQLGLAGDEIRFRPGQIIEAETGEVEQINKGITVDMSSERLEQQAKAYAEEYLSIADFSLRSAVNPGGSRTATEIQTVQQSSGRQISADIALFLETLSEVAQHMYFILKDSVDTPRYVGGTLLKPEDFLVKVNISWVGSVEATDAELQNQRALSRIQILMQGAAPAGLLTQENMYNLFYDWLNRDRDIENPDTFLTKPAEMRSQDVERQQEEIVRMRMGFDAAVHPNDNDDTHLQVVEAYMQDPNNAQALADQNFVGRLEKHISIHLQSEGMKNGQKNPGIKKETQPTQG